MRSHSKAKDINNNRCTTIITITITMVGEKTSTLQHRQYVSLYFKRHDVCMFKLWQCSVVMLNVEGEIISPKGQINNIMPDWSLRGQRGIHNHLPWPIFYGLWLQKDRPSCIVWQIVCHSCKPESDSVTNFYFLNRPMRNFSSNLKFHSIIIIVFFFSCNKYNQNLML